MLNQDVRVHILCLDIVQNAVDSVAFYDYLKQNYKKEVSFINALDVQEPVNRTLKADQKKGINLRPDPSLGIVRGIRQKIDQEVVKISDAKKKAWAAYEKQRAANVAGRGKGKHFEELSKYDFPFEGTIDALYILSNFPYLPHQLLPLSEIDIPVSFVCMVPKGGPVVIRGSPNRKTGGFEKSARMGKRAGVNGSELESVTNPQVYPPSRWQALKPTAPATIPFTEVEAADDIESTFKRLEKEIVRLMNGREEYTAKFSSKQFLTLPTSMGILDLRAYQDYLVERPGDTVNALLYSLKAYGFKTRAPAGEPPLEERYLAIFETRKQEINRTVVFMKPKDLPEPDFDISPFSALSSLLYRVTHWMLKPEQAALCKAVAQFLVSPENSYAYAGQKFDQLVQMVNKKYQLGLPLTYFDWMKWDWAIETRFANDSALVDAVHSSGIVETFLDDSIGIMWILTLPPIARVMGHFQIEHFVPPTMDGFTDFIQFLYQKDSEPEKKTRNMPSPAQIIRDKLNPNVLVQPLNDRFVLSSRVFGMPIDVANCTYVNTPYYFSSRTKVTVHRNLVSSQFSFGYSVVYKNLLEIEGTSESVVFIPIEGVRILVEFPFAVTVLFNEQSIRYDGKQFVIKSTGLEAMVITQDGGMVMKGKKDKRVSILPDGTIGQYKDGKWSYCLPNNSMYVKRGSVFEKVEGRSAEVDNIGKGTKSMIRPDETEYFVKADQTRRILIGDLSIEQGPTQFVWDIPNFPVLVKNGDDFSMALDLFEISFNGESAKIVEDDYSISINAVESVFVSSSTELCLKPNRCECKVGDQVLVSDADGTEKMTQINVEIPAKKKIEVYETHWGKALGVKDSLNEQQQLELHRLFVPRFFAVKTDLSCTEYLRSDSVDLTGVQERAKTVRHQTGVECQIVSHHKDDLGTIHVKNEPINKQNRSAILKGLHVPKQKKKKGEEEATPEELITSAQAAVESYLLGNQQFVEILGNTLRQEHDAYIDSVTPPPPEPPEFVMIPPQTPPPRILEMQANVHHESIPRNEDGTTGVLGYWNCYEAEFALPLALPNVLPRPLSPRVALCDPPRFGRAESPPVFTDAPLVTRHLRSWTRSSKNTATGKARPRTVKATPELINFGTVKAHTAATASLVVTNTGAKPWHFSVTQTGNPLVKVLTIPGVVFPGLRMTLKVALLPCEPQYISTVFTLMTKETMGEATDMRIPIVATIVE
jgi:hypothetical protein